VISGNDLDVADPVGSFASKLQYYVLIYNSEDYSPMTVALV
jgi:hypothetical protein